MHNNSMKSTQKILFVLGFPIVLASLLLAILPPHYSALAAECGGVETSFDFNCPDDADVTSGNLENNPIFTVLLFAINFLTAGIGIAAVGFITWGAIVYSTAGGNREKVQTAISYITNAVIGLLLFMSMFAIANFLIPGGVFN